MIRRAIKGDEADILAFLKPYAHRSMFLRSNLLAHGIGHSSAATATTYWLYKVGVQIQGVFGRSNSGYLMCQCPVAPDTVWQAFAKALQGQTIAGITGEVDQVERVLTALDLPAGTIGLNRTEPFYHLDLGGIGKCDADIRSPIAGDVDLLNIWYRAYLLETGIEEDNEELRQVSLERAQAAIGAATARLLIKDGVPVAMTAINARAESTVQIGGVYVPDALRGQGLAGQVVAAHLKELQADRIRDAVLFAASRAAAKAYERIGFQHVGFYQMAMLRKRIVYGVTA